jgi:hypothetical protein
LQHPVQSRQAGAERSCFHNLSRQSPRRGYGFPDPPCAMLVCEAMALATPGPGHLPPRHRGRRNECSFR